MLCPQSSYRNSMANSLTVVKETRLIMHSSIRKFGCKAIQKRSLGTAVLVRLQGVRKTRKTLKLHKIPKNSLVVNKNQRLYIGETLQTTKYTKAKKTTIFKCENWKKKKMEQKSAKSAKPKIPRLLLNDNFLNLTCTGSSPADL